METVETANKMSAAMTGAINGAIAISVFLPLYFYNTPWWGWIASGALIGAFNMLFVMPRERWTTLRWMALLTLPGLAGYCASWLVTQLF